MEDDEKNTAVIVPDYQLSLAIGKEGQNVNWRRVSGWKIDIKSHTQYFEGEGEIIQIDEDDEDTGEEVFEVEEK